MVRLKRHIPSSLTGALLLHGLVVLMILWAVERNQPTRVPGSPDVEVVHTTMIDAAEIERQRALKRQEEERARREAEQRRKAKEEAERKRQVELKKQQEAERKRQAELKKQQEAERKRQAELKKRQEAERKRQVELKKQQEAERKRQAELKEQQEAERKRKEAEATKRAAAESRRHNRQLIALQQRYKDAIAAKIERMWARPGTARPGDFCEVYVVQTPSGYLVDVQVRACRGDEQFRQSIRAAVLKAEPLPSPPSAEVFDREIKFTFKPEVE